MSENPKIPETLKTEEHTGSQRWLAIGFVLLIALLIVAGALGR